MKQILIGIGIGAFVIAWLTFFLWMLWRGFIAPLLKLFKKFVVLLWNYPSSIPLIAVNLIPLVGVFLLGWKAFELLYLYWLEVMVYSFFSAEKLKKVLAQAPLDQIPHIRITPFVIRKGRSNEETLQRIVPDFRATFRFVAVSTLVIIVILFGVSIKPLQFSFKFLGAPFAFLTTTLVALASYTMSHGFSYVRNFLGKEEYRRITLRQQLKAPLERLGVMWVATFMGSTFATGMGSPIAALVFLVFLKTACDVSAHIKEHDRIAKHPPSCEKFWEE